MFNKVEELTDNFRAQGFTSQQHAFREWLLRLRTGDSTEDDWRLILTPQPSAVKNISDFENATRFFIKMNKLLSITLRNSIATTHCSNKCPAFHFICG